MCQSQKIDEFASEDIARIEKMRDWVIGHFDNPDAYLTVSGKLRLVQTILDNKWIDVSETWKLQSLGIAFGDALAQEVDDLQWVVVDDEYGRDPALRWSQSTTLAFPLTAVSKRVEEGKEVDIYEMFSGFQKALLRAVADAT